MDALTYVAQIRPPSWVTVETTFLSCAMSILSMDVLKTDRP